MMMMVMHKEMTWRERTRGGNSAHDEEREVFEGRGAEDCGVHCSARLTTMFDHNDLVYTCIGL